MRVKEVKVKFDCAYQHLFDLVEACAWRVDPIRKKILQLNEHISSLKVVNVEKVTLPDEIEERISVLSLYDKEGADIAVKEIVLSELLLWLPADEHKEIRHVIEVEVGESDGSCLTSENVEYLLQEMSMNKDKLDEEAKHRIIEKPIREVFQQSLSPSFNKMHVGQREIISHISSTRDQVNKIEEKTKQILDLLSAKR
ncbi:hypothetical protein ACOJCM_10010 [Billgrantia sp. LNSP4103-1]|uniref:hypothetical protein n=1 Tax=Billgrantia sp. LNSP4103-1 TaxID=3410266 RepID=UPI00403F72C6